MGQQKYLQGFNNSNLYFLIMGLYLMLQTLCMWEDINDIDAGTQSPRTWESCRNSQ